MSDVTIKYKGATIATMDASGSKPLKTQGKYCEGDIGVEYVKPAGPSGTKQISITQNGTTTEDVAAYASAEITVDVQGGGGSPTLGLIATIPVESGVSIISYDLPEIALTYGVLWAEFENVTYSNDYLYAAVVSSSERPEDATGYKGKSTSYNNIAVCVFKEAETIGGTVFPGVTGVNFGTTGTNHRNKRIESTSYKFSRFVVKLYERTSVFNGGTIYLYGRIA